MQYEREGKGKDKWNKCRHENDSGKSEKKKNRMGL